MIATRLKKNGYNLQITLENGEYSLVTLGLAELRKVYQKHQALSAELPDPEDSDLPVWFAGEIAKIDEMLQQLN